MTRQEASKIIEQYRMCSSGDCPTLECADCEYNHDPRKVEEAFLMAIDALDEDKNVPSKDGDLIYRQDAIRVVSGLDSSFVKYIEELPSAQPDIIRCKDCRWQKDQSESTAWLPCRAIVTPSDFYCGRAERRTDE